jgi:hypothetical protein
MMPRTDREEPAMRTLASRPPLVIVSLLVALAFPAGRAHRIDLFAQSPAPSAARGASAA